jgi:GT2 family glycosyltransferase
VAQPPATVPAVRWWHPLPRAPGAGSTAAHAGEEIEVASQQVAARRELRSARPAPWITDVAARRRARERLDVVTHHPGGRTGTDGRVTVAVITADRRDDLLAVLPRLLALPERPHVIVVDNGSRDGTTDALRQRHPEVEVLRLAENRGAAARNAAVRAAATPYVAFNDDDTWWDARSLARAADVLDAHPDVAVLTATILVEPGGEEDPVVEDLRVSPLPDEPGLPGTPLLSILAGASVVRREAFLQVGGFEPRLLIGGEEELFSTDLASAGWALRHLPELVVHHRASPARDRHLRRAQGLRNTLWFAWLRRPVPDAWRRTRATLAGAPRDRITLRALAQALAGAAWIVRERRVAPAEVVAGLRALDRQQLWSKARRYVS